MRDNDIVFFNLHRRYLNNDPNYNIGHGIYQLSAFLNANGYKAQGFAGELYKGKLLIDEICSAQQTTVIGLYCDYENITENIFLSDYIKKTYGIPVFVGGPQSTALDADFITNANCDAVVRYEGELTVLELLHYFIDGTGSLENIKGIAYISKKGFNINPERELIENIDALPFVNDECYLLPKKRKYELSILTGRGCPFNCAFCHEGEHTKKVRLRSVENVLAEINAFISSIEDDGDFYIYFADDTFTLNSERIKKLCTGLNELRKKRDFRWFCEGHIHTLYLHPEMLTEMVQAGMKRIQLGIESGTEKVLKAYNKGCTSEEIKYVVKRCVAAGVEQIYGNILLSGAFFDKAVYENERSFAQELLNLAPGRLELGVVTFWPLPNTAITSKPADYGIKIIDKNFITAVGDFPQVETEELSRYDIIGMMQELEKDIEETMKNIIRSGVLTTQQVLSWFNETNTGKYRGYWFYCLLGMPNVYNYYYLIKIGEAYSGDELIGTNYLSLHPMRTIALYKNWRFKANGFVEIFGCLLNSFEQDVLVYATGKLNIKQILSELQSNGYEAAGLLQKCTECLHKLEKNYLVVYSKF